ncbi:MAG: protoheme IX farnesyltransferase, partial [Chitinophagaceae bacterium]|nr:protoheme IX farnesyltransferase [Chitinophagaceae bacterium]
MLLKQKWHDYRQLMKLNLSLLVVCSSVVGYLIVPSQPDGVKPVSLGSTLLLFLGGLLVTAAANASNEILERDTDLLMRRTADRPLPDNRMSIREAVIFSALSLLSGLIILFQFNFQTVLLALFSYALYVFVYTPLKRISPISVLVGAIPGSLPCVIGWVAATNHMGSIAAWTLFIIQFFWQFPHFWAIAWLGHDDYEKAGLKMLPRAGKEGHFTASQTLVYSAVLLPLSVLPMIAYEDGFGWISFTGLLLGACWMLFHAVRFLKETTDTRAKQVMF